MHPTEGFAITSASDNSIRVWDLLNNKILKQYDHQSEIFAVDWSKGGMFIAAGSIQGELILFDSQLNKLRSAETGFAKAQ